MKTYAGPFDLHLNKEIVDKKHTGQSMCNFHNVCWFFFKCSQFNLVGFLQSLILPYCVKPQEILWMCFYLRFYCCMDLLLIFFFPFSAYSSQPPLFGSGVWTKRYKHNWEKFLVDSTPRFKKTLQSKAKQTKPKSTQPNHVDSCF